MHEMSIANSVLDAVRTEARRFPSAHICRVGLRIGALAGVDPDALSFCFEALVRETELDPLALEIEYCPRTHRCRGCGVSFAAPAEGSACPDCGGVDSEFIGGDELELAYLEVEDGAHTAGTQSPQ
jgi:hydrogenase nickel incorporation protein HypA/HybF